MNTIDIPAKDVHEGQQIAAIPGETVRRRRTGWPTVTEASFLQNGEGGQPTVYIETHEMPGWTWCLRPDDPVTILVGESEPPPRRRSWFRWLSQSR